MVASLVAARLPCEDAPFKGEGAQPAVRSGGKRAAEWVHANLIGNLLKEHAKLKRRLEEV